MLSSVVNWYGSEPVWSTSARFFASLNELRPVICALPLMPFESELSFGSICGNDLISRSRTIAKCCGAPSRLPRW